MALIKCPFCGESVSDEADKCPHCGADLKSGFLCPECGTSLKSLDRPCPKCGCPPDKLKLLLHQDNEQNVQQTHSKRRSANWVVIVIIAIALVVAGAIFLDKRQSIPNHSSDDNVENIQSSSEADNSEGESDDKEEAEGNNEDEQVLLKKLLESDNNTMSFTTDLTRGSKTNRWYMVLLAESEDKTTGRAYVGESDDGMATFIPDFVFLYEVSDNHLKLSHGGSVRERNPLYGYVLESYPQEFDLEITSDGYTPLLTGIAPGDRSHTSRKIRYFNNSCPYGQKLRKFLHW
jgi:hypothetical protein